MSLRAGSAAASIACATTAACLGRCNSGRQPRGGRPDVHHVRPVHGERAQRLAVRLAVARVLVDEFLLRVAVAAQPGVEPEPLPSGASPRQISRPPRNLYGAFRTAALACDSAGAKAGDASWSHRAAIRVDPSPVRNAACANAQPSSMMPMILPARSAASSPCRPARRGCPVASARRWSAHGSARCSRTGRSA